MNDANAEYRLEVLSEKIATLRDLFPWDEKYDIDKGCNPGHPKAWCLGEIMYGPEHCLDAMIRQLNE